jgi:hypothetical protein
MRHNKLLTNLRKSKMHIGSPYCKIYIVEVETELHVMRDCPHSMALWLKCVDSNDRLIFFNSNLEQWIDFNLKENMIVANNRNWPAYWLLVVIHFGCGIIKLCMMTLLLDLYNLR